MCCIAVLHTKWACLAVPLRALALLLPLLRQTHPLRCVPFWFALLPFRREARRHSPCPIKNVEKSFLVAPGKTNLAPRDIAWVFRADAGGADDSLPLCKLPNFQFGALVPILSFGSDEALKLHFLHDGYGCDWRLRLARRNEAFDGVRPRFPRL